MNKLQCPICGRPMSGQGPGEWPEFPFCSPRCRLIDLGRWLGERYRLRPETEGEGPAENPDDIDIP